MPAGKLSKKQELFCLEYVKDFNASRAAKDAGYSEKTAGSMGHENLKKPEIQHFITSKIAELTEALEVDDKRIIAEFSLVAFQDMKDYVDIDPDTGSIQIKGFDDMPENGSRVIAAIEEHQTIKESNDGAHTILNSHLKFKHHDKMKALEMLMRYKNLFKHEQAPININVGTVMQPAPVQPGAPVPKPPTPEEAAKTHTENEKKLEKK